MLHYAVVFLVIALIAAVAATTQGMFLEEGTSEVSVSGLLDFESANGTVITSRLCSSSIASRSAHPAASRNRQGNSSCGLCRASMCRIQ